MSIEEFNPWWRGREYINYDPDIVKWSRAKVKWTPREINAN